MADQQNMIREDSDHTKSASREEFTRLWLASEASVSTYVFASIAEFHDAEDVVQQIALNAASRFDDFDQERPFLGWILWIAKSRILNFYRQQGRRKVHFSDEVLQQLADAISTREATIGNRRREALELCLERLPDRSRQLLDLRYIQELSTKKIAAAVELTGGSVRVTLTRIRTALGDCIQHRLSTEEV